MKSILMSFKPQTVARILNGEQTMLIAKSTPKETPFKVYIYCTKAKDKLVLEYDSISKRTAYDIPFGGVPLHGKVVAEFICKYIEKRSVKALKHSFSNYNSFCQMAGCQPFQYEEINRYITNKEFIYALHITDLKIYDKPRELGEFRYLKKERYGSESVGYIVDKYIAQVTRPPQNYMFVKEVEK